MKASIIISVVFFLFALATAIEVGEDALATSTEVGVGVSDGVNKPVFDEQGHPINRKHRCFIRAHVLGTEATSDNFLVIFDGNLSKTPFVYSRTQDYDTRGDRVTFHSKEAADPNQYLTVSTTYGLTFGSGKFWESNFGADEIVQKGTSISDCGTFMMEEIKDPNVNHQTYKLVYYRGTKEVGFVPSIGVIIYQMATITPSNLAFSFYQCQP